MNNAFAIVSEREKGQFPVSIATSLALEGAAGIHPDHPETGTPAFATPPKQLWINVRTLFRNLMGALTADAKSQVLSPVLHTAMVEEMAIIEGVVIKQTNGRTTVVYYVCDYTGLERKHPKALLKAAKTDNQRAYLGLEQQTLRLLVSEHGSHDLRVFRMNITGPNGESWIITHLPFDLLSKSSFASLKLLESHTGVLKGPALWYTKLNDGNSLPNIPFCAFSLQMFGDGGHQFSPQPRVIKEEALRLAEEFKWNTTTSRERMLLSFNTIKDPMTKKYFMELL